MATTYNNFFYDKQIRRFIQQFIRILSNFQVEMGNDDQGNRVLHRVPVFYGDQNRQAAQILRNNSENALASVPAMAVYINGYDYDRTRVQEPFHISKMELRERARDPVTGEYTQLQGDTITVERMMPVPYKLTLKLDMWTSSIDQKLQLLEQISVLFNPSFEVQSTDNYVDWTSLSAILLTGTTFTSRTIPTGQNDSIDIATMTFELPIWISPPAKVKRLGVIHKMITSLYDANGELSQDLAGAWDLLDRKAYTFTNYKVLYQGNTLKLLLETEIDDIELLSSQADLDRIKHPWQPVIETYGNLNSGISQIRLMTADGSEIVGTVAYHPTDPTLLTFTPDVDTLPSNSLTAINAIINPLNVNVDEFLANPAKGTRYLLTDDIGSYDNAEGAPAWNKYPGLQELVASANDIVEFNGTIWAVAFDSSRTDSVQYVTNLKTGIQYKWDGTQWTKSVEGIYRALSWSLSL